MKHRCVQWVLSGTTCYFIDDLSPEKLEARLAFMRSMSNDHGARLCTVEVREVSEERDAEAGGADVGGSPV